MKFYKNPLSTLNNRFNLSIITAIKAEIANDWGGEDITSPFSRLYYVKNGSGIIANDDELIYLKPGYIYLIPVGKRVSFKSNGNMEKIYIHFNITKPDGYDLLKDFVKIGELERDSDYIKKIYTLFDSTSISDKFILEAYIKYDVAQFIEHYGMSSNLTPSSPNVKKAMELIQKKPTIALSVSDIANKLFVSERLLSKQFKKETGMTVSEYLDQMIFYDAQIQLIETDKSIEEISQYYGFCDRFYFSKRFKQLFQYTPAEYRKRLKIKSN